MSTLIRFDLPKQVGLPKIIGVLDHQLYVLVKTKKRADVWTINVFIPNSWKKKWTFNFEEVAYLTATVNPNDGCIFFLFTGCYVGEDTYCLDILRLNIDEEDYTKYKSTDAVSVFELAELYDVHFETDTLCCGINDLYIYDRGLVSGQIPFTRLTLNHVQKTFAGTKDPIIADDPGVQPSIFGSLIDADKKKFVKLAENNSLRLFDSDLDKWISYKQSKEDSDFYLHELATDHRGIGVTYNQEYTRFAMVSSPLKLVAGDGEFLLAYKHNGKVLFLRVLFDNENQEFRLKKVAKITHSINQGYMFCNRRELIILAQSSYCIPLQVLTLKEAAFKSAQQLVDKDAEDDSEIRKKCGIANQRPLI